MAAMKITILGNDVAAETARHVFDCNGGIN
jgi:hypothetical protein